jgi:transcriptional regulator with XRE-family HTH domain
MALLMSAQPPPPGQFALRLRAAVTLRGITQAELADEIGIDRSSLSQFLSATSGRYPRAETLASLARALGSSTDWLLGLTDTDPAANTTTLVDESLAFESVSREPVDEQLVGWLSEARGDKVRYAPATLPDLLKTDAVIRHELMATVGPEVRIENAAIKLAWQRTPEADVECVNSIQSIEALARGEDIWRSLSAPRRIEQLERMAALVDELYPAFRWFLIDRRQRYAAPITIFGKRRASLYIGGQYVVFNQREHVVALASHFDQHLRMAIVEPRQVSARIRKLIGSVR